MNVVKLIIIIVFTALASAAYCQKDFREGYIIQNSKDTLRGFIDLGSNIENSRKCIFKSSTEGETRIFFPNEIQSYRLGDEKYYVSKMAKIGDKDSLVFLEYLVDGILDLYYLNLPSEEYYFLEVEGGSLLRLSNNTKTIKKQQEGYLGRELTYSGNSNQYRRLLTAAFRDSPETLEKIPNTSFTHQGLINITKSYHENTCDWACTLFGRKKTNLVFLEPILGYRFSKQGLKTSNDRATNNASFVGLNFRTTSFRLHYLWTWNFGLTFSQNSFDGIYSHKNGTSTLSPDRVTRLKADYISLSFPISAEYTLPTSGIKPFFVGGIEPIFAVNVDHQVADQAVSGIRGNIIREDEIFRKLQIGLFTGAGLRRDIGSNYVKVLAQFGLRRPIGNSAFLFDRHYISEWRLSLLLGLKVRGEGSEFKK
ncbi:MAG: hypothetical protein JXR10_07550 [Cyclobacteriaceae bacterium]